MNRFIKKLYYKYYDLLQLGSFKGDFAVEQYANQILNWFKSNSQVDFNHICERDIPAPIPPQRFLEELNEFKKIGTISYIDNYLKSVDTWMLNIVLPGYFDNKQLKAIILDNKIDSPHELISYFRSDAFINNEGIDKSNLYAHIVSSLQWSDFPYVYAIKHSLNDKLLSNLNGCKLNGNFHNHTLYSDGTCSIRDIVTLAENHYKEFVGISDHSKRMKGVDENLLQNQLKEIDSLQSESDVAILKSIECEILKDGTLDLSPNVLHQLDYVIIAIHTDICMAEKDMERRLIRAIENPLSNILAHPSARIYGKKPPILVNMCKIIDACASNNVAIEINGDPSRLDLSPRLIDYALNKGVMFTLDSDTHKPEGYWNINNAIQIASDYHIPPEGCLNTFNHEKILNYFSS